MADSPIRWRLADDDGGQGSLFADDELVEHHVGKGEFRGLEFFHVNARRIINEVPAASQVPFRYTINAYRGCSHACTYCCSPDTPVLMADGRVRTIADIRPGDAVYGTERVGAYRRYVPTQVLDHWETRKRAWRVVLEDGTELVASGDHRFLTNRGWKFVSGTDCGEGQRPHLTTTHEMFGTGKFAAAPKHDEEYRRGYLCGMIRGDRGLAYGDERAGRSSGDVNRFRFALADREALERSRRFLSEAGISTDEFLFAVERESCRGMDAMRNRSCAASEAIRALVAWPTSPSVGWSTGFLAGIFDAEGSYRGGILRISTADEAMLRTSQSALTALGFEAVIEPPRANGCRAVRVPGAVREHLRFFHAVDPATTRKRIIDGRAIKNTARLRVVAVRPLGIEIPMYDITTGTGDFIANGVVSHNCFARPTHDYLGLNVGEDFERKIVVKVNAVERLAAELRSPKWAGEHIAMGTNTDPYQRCEGKYHLTQGIVRVLGERANPFSILTKSTLILRDLELLKEAARRTTVKANFSIGTLDDEVWRLTEPGTPHPRRRVEAVAKLNDAGIECGVLVAPIIPEMSDHPEQLEEVVKACVEAGATSITAIPLHLRRVVKEHFMGWLGGARPDLVPLYRRRYRRGGYLPQDDQEQITRTVRHFLDDARGDYVPPQRTRPTPEPVAVPVDVPAVRPPEQLTLG